MAETLDITTLALGRIDTDTGTSRISAQNRKGVDVRASWSNCEDGPRAYYVDLSSTEAQTDKGLRDVLILQTSVGSLTNTQHTSMTDLAPFLMALWAERPPGFEQYLDRIRIELSGSILHVNNPCGLTRSETASL